MSNNYLCKTPDITKSVFEYRSPIPSILEEKEESPQQNDTPPPLNANLQTPPSKKTHDFSYSNNSKSSIKEWLLTSSQKKAPRNYQNDLSGLSKSMMTDVKRLKILSIFTITLEERLKVHSLMYYKTAFENMKSLSNRISLRKFGFLKLFGFMSKKQKDLKKQAISVFIEKFAKKFKNYLKGILNVKKPITPKNSQQRLSTLVAKMLKLTRDLINDQKAEDFKVSSKDLNVLIVLQRGLNLLSFFHQYLRKKHLQFAFQTILKRTVQSIPDDDITGIKDFSHYSIILHPALDEKSNKPKTKLLKTPTRHNKSHLDNLLNISQSNSPIPVHMLSQQIIRVGEISSHDLSSYYESSINISPEKRIEKFHSKLQNLNYILKKKLPSMKSRHLHKFLQYDHALFQVFRISESSQKREKLIALQKIINFVTKQKTFGKILNNLFNLSKRFRSNLTLKYLMKWQKGENFSHSVVVAEPIQRKTDRKAELKLKSKHFSFIFKRKLRFAWEKILDYIEWEDILQRKEKDIKFLYDLSQIIANGLIRRKASCFHKLMKKINSSSSKMTKDKGKKIFCAIKHIIIRYIRPNFQKIVFHSYNNKIKSQYLLRKFQDFPKNILKKHVENTTKILTQVKINHSLIEKESSNSKKISNISISAKLIAKFLISKINTQKNQVFYEIHKISTRNAYFSHESHKNSHASSLILTINSLIKPRVSKIFSQIREKANELSNKLSQSSNILENLLETKRKLCKKDAFYTLIIREHREAFENQGKFFHFLRILKKAYLLKIFSGFSALKIHLNLGYLEFVISKQLFSQKKIERERYIESLIEKIENQNLSEAEILEFLKNSYGEMPNENVQIEKSGEGTQKKREQFAKNEEIIARNKGKKGKVLRSSASARYNNEVLSRKKEDNEDNLDKNYGENQYNIEESPDENLEYNEKTKREKDLRNKLLRNKQKNNDNNNSEQDLKQKSDENEQQFVEDKNEIINKDYQNNEKNNEKNNERSKKSNAFLAKSEEVPPIRNIKSNQFDFKSPIESSDITKPHLEKDEFFKKEELEFFQENHQNSNFNTDKTQNEEYYDNDNEIDEENEKYGENHTHTEENYNESDKEKNNESINEIDNEDEKDNENQEEIEINSEHADENDNDFEKTKEEKGENYENYENDNFYENENNFDSRKGKRADKPLRKNRMGNSNDEEEGQNYYDFQQNNSDELPTFTKQQDISANNVENIYENQGNFNFDENNHQNNFELTHEDILNNEKFQEKISELENYPQGAIEKPLKNDKNLKNNKIFDKKEPNNISDKEEIKNFSLKKDTEHKNSQTIDNNPNKNNKTQKPLERKPTQGHKIVDPYEDFIKKNLDYEDIRENERVPETIQAEIKKNISGKNPKNNQNNMNFEDEGDLEMSKKNEKDKLLKKNQRQPAEKSKDDVNNEQEKEKIKQYLDKSPENELVSQKNGNKIPQKNEINAKNLLNKGPENRKTNNKVEEFAENINLQGKRPNNKKSLRANPKDTFDDFTEKNEQEINNPATIEEIPSENKKNVSKNNNNSNFKVPENNYTQNIKEGKMSNNEQNFNSHKTLQGKETEKPLIKKEPSQNPKNFSDKPNANEKKIKENSQKNDKLAPETTKKNQILGDEPLSKPKTSSEYRINKKEEISEQNEGESNENFEEYEEKNLFLNKNNGKQSLPNQGTRINETQGESKKIGPTNKTNDNKNKEKEPLLIKNESQGPKHIPSENLTKNPLKNTKSNTVPEEALLQKPHLEGKEANFKEKFPKKEEITQDLSRVNPQNLQKDKNIQQNPINKSNSNRTPINNFDDEDNFNINNPKNKNDRQLRAKTSQNSHEPFEEEQPIFNQKLDQKGENSKKNPEFSSKKQETLLQKPHLKGQEAYFKEKFPKNEEVTQNLSELNPQNLQQDKNIQQNPINKSNSNKLPINNFDNEDNFNLNNPKNKNDRQMRAKISQNSHQPFEEEQPTFNQKLSQKEENNQKNPELNGKKQSFERVPEKANNSQQQQPNNEPNKTMASQIQPENSKDQLLFSKKHENYVENPETNLKLTNFEPGKITNSREANIPKKPLKQKTSNKFEQPNENFQKTNQNSQKPLDLPRSLSSSAYSYNHNAIGRDPAFKIRTEDSENPNITEEGDEVPYNRPMEFENNLDEQYFSEKPEFSKKNQRHLEPKHSFKEIQSENYLMDSSNYEKSEKFSDRNSEKIESHQNINEEKGPVKHKETLSISLTNNKIGDMVTHADDTGIKAYFEVVCPENMTNISRKNSDKSHLKSFEIMQNPSENFLNNTSSDTEKQKQKSNNRPHEQTSIPQPLIQEQIFDKVSKFLHEELVPEKKASLKEKDEQSNLPINLEHNQEQYINPVNNFNPSQNPSTKAKANKPQQDKEKDFKRKPFETIQEEEYNPTNRSEDKSNSPPFFNKESSFEPPTHHTSLNNYHSAYESLFYTNESNSQNRFYKYNSYQKPIVPQDYQATKDPIFIKSFDDNTGNIPKSLRPLQFNGENEKPLNNYLEVPEKKLKKNFESKLNKSDIIDAPQKFSYHSGRPHNIYNENRGNLTEKGKKKEELGELFEEILEKRCRSLKKQRQRQSSIEISNKYRHEVEIKEEINEEQCFNCEFCGNNYVQDDSYFRELLDTTDFLIPQKTLNPEFLSDEDEKQEYMPDRTLNVDFLE